MNEATRVVERAGWSPEVGDPEFEEAARIFPQRVPAENGSGPHPAAEPALQQPEPAPASANGTSTVTTAAHAAPAQASAKAAKKPLLDPSKYRKAKAPAAEEGISDAAQTTIPVRKPGSRTFFRAHPDEEYRLYNVPLAEDDKHEWHILSPDLEIPEDLERFISHVNLITCLNHKGTLFLWPYKNSTNDWSKSASRGVRRAVTEWIRLIPDMDANGYRIETAPPELRAVEPVWPKMTFEEILNTAFESKCIDSLNHPVIRSLRGLGYGAL